MRLVLDRDPTIHVVKSYDAHSVTVGEERLTHSFWMTRDRLERDWGARALATLDEALLAAPLATRPKIVLLGVNQPSPRAPLPLRRLLEARGIALEALELGAACRTYDVLAQENREVLLGVVFPD